MKPGRHERKTRQVPLANIILDDGPRPLDPSRVEVLARSMATLGLHTPIFVDATPGPDGFMSPDPDKQTYKIISGRHRVAAASSLGWEAIEALDFADNIYFDQLATQAMDENGDYEEPDFDIAARMWAIAENLHRAELTALQRSEQIAEWITLEKKWRDEVDRVSAQSAQKPQGGRPKGGLSAAARGLGLDRDDARRAVEVAKLSEEAKSAAVEAKLDDNRTALLEAAKAPAQEQARVIRDIAEQKQAGRNKIDTDVKARAAREVAEMISEHVPGEWWDALKANLYAAGAANIAHELTNITGQSIMDRRGW